LSSAQVWVAEVYVMVMVFIVVVLHFDAKKKQ